MREDYNDADIPAVTWWEVIFKTPLSDVLRGDWSSRGNYQRTLQECSLPGVVTERIERIIRKSHLWRNERNDVARELIAHFQEGLDRGTSASLLVDRFGDVKTTARLIRRAKLRKRPIWWRTWYGVSRSFVATAAVLFFVYVVQAIRLFTSHSVVDRNYLAELNAPIRAIPEKDRAWPRYIETMHDFPAWPNGLRDEKLAQVDTSSPDWPRIVELLAHNRERIEALQEIALMPHLGLILGDPNSPTNRLTDSEFQRYGFFQTPPEYLEPSNPRLDSVHVGEYVLFYEAGRLLSFAALDAAARGDANEVVKNVTALIGMGDQGFRNRPFSIEQMSGLFAYMRACSIVRFVLAEYPPLLTDSQLHELMDQIRSINGGERFYYRFDNDMLGWKDFIQRYYTSGPNGHLSNEGWEFLKPWVMKKRLRTQESLEGPLAMTVAISRGEAKNQIKELYRQIDELKTKEPWERKDNEIEGELQELNASFMGYPLNPIGLLVEDGINFNSLSLSNATTARDATEIAVALNLYKREQGRWPTELGDLVPRYLDSIPSDPNDGKPLRYRLTDGGPLLYAIGADRHDDGGRPTHESRNSIWYIDYRDVSKDDALKIHNDPLDARNGDWILWPPVSNKGE